MKTEIDLEKIDLKTGGHRTREEGVCIMEAVAWAAGESHSDFPLCTDRVIARCAQILNDKMPTPLRNELLKPLIFKMIGTSGGLKLKIKRAFVAADYAIRVFAPLALEAQGKKELAEKLRALPEIIDRHLTLREKKLIGNAAVAAYAAYAASAYAAAAYTAYTATAHADAAADAAAADAAHTAAAAAYVAIEAHKNKIWNLAVEMLVKMIEIK